jgi:hypothetical protein
LLPPRRVSWLVYVFLCRKNFVFYATNPSGIGVLKLRVCPMKLNQVWLHRGTWSFLCWAGSWISQSNLVQASLGRRSLKIVDDDIFWSSRLPGRCFDKHLGLFKLSLVGALQCRKPSDGNEIYWRHTIERCRRKMVLIFSRTYVQSITFVRMFL